MSEPEHQDGPLSSERPVIRSTAEAQRWLRKLDLPHSDDIELRASTGTFADGSAYGLEILGINSLRSLRAIIEALDGAGAYCTRFNETYGSFLLSNSELSEMFALASEHDHGLVVGLGPRPEYDVTASFARSDFGLEMGRRINNNDALAVAVQEALRLADLGCKGLLIYDLGVLRALSALRDRRALPADVRFKTSSHCMISNPLLARIALDNGADSVTTAHDLGLPVLQEIRRMCPGLVLDVPIDVCKAKGGFLRFHEVSEIIQVAAPVFLKIGGSTQKDSYSADDGNAQLEAKAARARLALDFVDRHLPDAKQLGPRDELACVPKLPGG